MLTRILLSAAMLPALVSMACAADMTADYTCADGTRMTVIFHTPATEPGSVELSLAASGKRIDLPQVLSADGGRYAGGKIEFWIKGRQASFRHDGKATTCETKQ
ncbi:MliC family protein [Rhizobium sp. A37_96]